MNAKRIIAVLNECAANGTDAYGLAVAIAEACEADHERERARAALLCDIVDAVKSAAASSTDEVAAAFAELAAFDAESP